MYKVKREAEREILANIPDHAFDVVCLEDNKSKISWEEKDKEFRLDGKMYDVAHTRVKDGKTLIYCYNDSKEEKLIDTYSKKLISENNHKDKQVTVKFQTGDWTNAPPVATFIKKTLFASNTKFKEFEEDICSLSREVVSPPPDLGYIPVKYLLMSLTQKAYLYPGIAIPKNFECLNSPVFTYSESEYNHALPGTVAENNASIFIPGIHLTYGFITGYHSSGKFSPIAAHTAFAQTSHAGNYCRLYSSHTQNLFI